MGRQLYHSQPIFLRKAFRLILAFCWISGLACGISVFDTAGTSLISLMRGILTDTMSAVSMLWAAILPFLITFFCFFLSAPVLVFPVCFCKAFLFSFISFGIFRCFGSAGWLLRYLLLFVDCVTAPILYWVWLHGLSGTRSLSGGLTMLLFALGLLTGSLNYCITSPFLAYLIDL